MATMKKRTKKGSRAPVSRSTRRAGASARSKKGAKRGLSRGPRAGAKAGVKRSPARGLRAGAKAGVKRSPARGPRAGTKAASNRSTARRPEARSRGAAAKGAAARATRVERIARPLATQPSPSKSRARPAAGRSPQVEADRRATPAVRRRDGTGHIDPGYAADLLARRGTSDRDEGDPGFLQQPRSGDDLAENLGEEFVASATSGENQEEEVLDREVPEERGGPFVESTGGTEFAWGTDASNPKSAKREPFPTT